MEVLFFSEKERVQFRDLFAAVHEDSTKILELVDSVDLLENDTKEAIHDFMNDDRDPFFVVKTWLFDPDFKTPNFHSKSYSARSYLGDTMLYSLMRYMWVGLQYEWHYGGEYINDICPKKKSAGKQVGSTWDFLEYHTEAAHVRYNPDFVLLYCVRNNDKIPTYVTSIWDIELDPETESQLRLGKYCIRSDESYSVGHSDLFPIIYDEWGVRRFRFDPCFTESDEDGMLAMSKLRDEVDKKRKTATLSSGDIFIMDNRFTTHARDRMSMPKFDGSDRFLQRTYVMERADTFEGHVLKKDRFFYTLGL